MKSPQELEVEKLQLELAELRRSHESQLAAERQNLSRLFDNSSGFVAVMKGPELVYTYVNAAHIKIIGSDLRGISIFKGVPQAIKLHALLKKVYETGVPVIDNELPVMIEGEAHYMNANYVASRNPNGEIDGVMAWGIDVSEQVLSRKKLEVSNHALQSEKKMRERFVEALTHDLRTPMTAARINAQLLERKSADPEYVKIAARRIINSVDRSDRMILDLLDANRIKAGEGVPMKIDECRLDVIAAAVAADFATIHGPRFRLMNEAGQITGFWDETGIQRIIENLSGNAVKYGSEKTPIQIKLAKKDNWVEIAVHNEGNPINQDDLGMIFDTYSRTESASTGGQKGWGIGLALVKAIAEAHGGNARVESSFESGTTFTIVLPVDSRHHE